jgi:LCP family protein required for cell wall assembly
MGRKVRRGEGQPQEPVEVSEPTEAPADTLTEAEASEPVEAPAEAPAETQPGEQAEVSAEALAEAPVKGKKHRWRKVLLWTAVGLVVAILAGAGGFYLWFHGQVSASNSRVDPAIIAVLRETTSTTTAPAGSPASTVSTLPEGPSAMNIVLVGYDKRPPGSKEVTEGRSDTIILVHIDPDRNFISLLSVPRDMLADVPGYGLYKLNAAFAFGGGALLIRTIQSKLGLDLDHYIALNLEGFQAVTNALGGVYLDVDRRYYNETLAWEHIDLWPGYQLLDGAGALDYVRFRHDDNIDFGRMERQQQFISAVREQALGWNLTFKIPSLVKALFSNLDTDLSATELIKLGYWIMKLDSGRIKQAEIKAGTGTIHGIFYVLPTDAELSAAVQDFYTPPGQTAGTTTTSITTATSAAPAPVAATLTPVDLGGTKVDVINATGRVGQGAFATVWLSHQGATVVSVKEATAPVIGSAAVQYPSGRSRDAQSVAQTLGISRVTEVAGLEQVTVVLGSSYLLSGAQLSGSVGKVSHLADWQSLAGATAFTVSAPTYIPDSFSYSFQRSYEVIPGDKSKPAVRVGYKSDSADRYLGVSESTWVDAPLASPGAKVQGDGVVFTVVGSSTKIDHVWWVQNGVLCWVTNTLFADLDREQLLAVAVSMAAIPASSK